MVVISFRTLARGVTVALMEKASRAGERSGGGGGGSTRAAMMVRISARKGIRGNPCSMKAAGMWTVSIVTIVTNSDSL